MALTLQLANDTGVSCCDVGMLSAFVCPECKIAAPLVQSH